MQYMHRQILVVKFLKIKNKLSPQIVRELVNQRINNYKTDNNYNISQALAHTMLRHCTKILDNVPSHFKTLSSLTLFIKGI